MAGYTERPTVHVTFDDNEASALLGVIARHKDGAEKRGQDPGAETSGTHWTGVPASVLCASGGVLVRFLHQHNRTAALNAACPRM